MYTQNLKTKINLRLSNNDYDELCKLAAERGVSVSGLLRYIIRDYLRRFTH